MVGLLRKVFGDANEKALKRFHPLVAEVSAHEAPLRDVTVEELRARTDDFRRRLADGVPLDDLLPEAMAVAREAIARRTGSHELREVSAVRCSARAAAARIGGHHGGTS